MKTMIQKAFIVISLLFFAMSVFSIAAYSATISEITAQQTKEDIAVSIPFTVTATGEVSIAITSSDQNLLPDKYLLYDSDGMFYTMVATPAYNAFGTATISITVDDDDGLTASSFTLTVTDTDDSLFYWKDIQKADVVIGESGVTLQFPSDVVVDPLTGKIFVCDTMHHQVLRFASADAAELNGATAEDHFGGKGIAADKMDEPSGLFIDTFGCLWVADTKNNRILRFDNASSKPSGSSADGVLGQTDFESNTSETSQNNMSQPTDVWVDSAGRLWVADSGNHRILRFDNARKKENGGNADAVLGQPDFDTANPGTSSFKMNNPRSIMGLNQNDLFVADYLNNRVLCFRNAAAKSYTDNADMVIGHRSYTENSAGNTDSEFKNPTGLSIDSYGRLYVTDQNNNRVLIFNDILNKSDGDASDHVIDSNVLSFPNNLNYDQSNNALWVADSMHNRILRFPLNTKTTPVISQISSQTITENTAAEPIILTVTDSDTQSLTISYSFSNATLLTSNNFTFIGAQPISNESAYTILATSTPTTITLNIVPIKEQSGFAFITITVTDPDCLSASSQLSITVTEFNDPPTIITSFENQSMDEDGTSSPIPFTITDIEGDTMQITITSSDPNLFPSDSNSIALSNSSDAYSYTFITESDTENLTLTLKPQQHKNGSAIMTIALSDGTNQISESFTITVNPVNDPPIISTLLDDITIKEDNPSELISFTVSDIDTTALTILIESNDPILFPSDASHITLCNKDGGTSYTLTTISQSEQLTLQLLPATEKSGTASISVTVTDGLLTTTETISITVTSIDDPPTITSISSQTVNEDHALTEITFSVIDKDSDQLTVIVKSDNDSLFPSDTNHITLSNNPAGNSYTLVTSPGNLTLTLMPATNQYGTSNITVYVSDESTTISTSFSVTVVSDGQFVPIISAIEPQNTIEDMAVSIPFIVTAYENIDITYTSSNQKLIPDANITHISENMYYTLIATPALNEFGTSTITITATNSEGVSSISFVLTVTSVNDPPTIQQIDNQYLNEDEALTGITFTVYDAEADYLSITAVSNVIPSDPDHITLCNIHGGTSYKLLTQPGMLTLSLMPPENWNGTTYMIVMANDGITETRISFILNIISVNDPPEISPITNQTVSENSKSNPINLTVVDDDNDELTIEIQSNNTNLIPSDTQNITLSNETDGGGYTLVSDPGSLTLVLQPLPNQTGNSVITVLVNDGHDTESQQFTITVSPINHKPTITTTILDQTINEDTTSQFISFTVTDADADMLTISVISSDESIIPANAGHLTIQNADGDTDYPLMTAQGKMSLKFSPLSNMSGSLELTVTVFDGSLADSTSFFVTVNEINDPPEISHIDTQFILEDTEISDISITVSDEDTNSLTVTILSGNETLVPSNTASITLRNNTQGNSYTLITDSGSNLSLSILPAANESGTVTITVSVTDGISLSVKPFVLSITPVNDVPIIADISDQTFDEDDKNIEIAFRVDDFETNPNCLTITMESSNQAILKNDGFSSSCNGNQYTLYLTPETDANGIVDITLTAKDSGGLTSSNKFKLELNQVNDAPTITITNKTFETKENTPISITGISINDIDAENEQVMISLIAGPVGTITFNGQNASTIPYTGTISEINNLLSQLIYEPENGANGSNYITITINDLGHSGKNVEYLSDTDSITIQILAINDSPVITLQNSFSIKEDESGSFTATISDADDISVTVRLLADRGILHISPVEGLSGFFAPADAMSFTGTIANINIALSTISYTPPADFSGSSNITITAFDFSNGQDIKHMKVEITPENDSPVLTCSSLPYAITEDTSLALSASITDVDSDEFEVFIALANGKLNFTDTSAVTAGNDGNITLTGSLSDINKALNAFEFIPAADYFGDTGITITVNDKGTPVKKSISIQIKPVNDSPVFIINTSSISVLQNFSDPQVITVSMESFFGESDAVTFTLTPAGIDFANVQLAKETGTITITAIKDKNGEKSFTLTATDDEKSSHSESFTLTVKAPDVNEPPVIIISNETVSEKQGTMSIGIPITVTDVEGDTMTITMTSSDISIFESMTLSNSSVSSSYTLITEADTDLLTLTIIPKAGQSGSAIISIRVSDGYNEALKTVDLQILPVNQPPVISEISDQTFNEDTESKEISFTVTDADSNSLTVSVVSDNPILIPSNSANITLLNRDGSHSYTLTVASQSDQLTLLLKPGLNENGSAIVTVSVTDGYSETEESFSINVTPVNDLPVISAIANQTISKESESRTITMTVSDVDNDKLTIEIQSSNENLIPADSQHITLSNASGGNSYSIISDPGNLTLVFMPVPNQTGSSVITVLATDVQDTITQTFTITVPFENHQPLISDLSDQTIEEDSVSQFISFTVADEDSDMLQISVISSDETIIPSNADHLAIQNADGVKDYPLTTQPGVIKLQITPLKDQSGTLSLTVTVFDGTDSSNKAITVTVNEVNDAPTISDIGTQTTNEDIRISNISFTVSDVDTSSLTVSIMSGDENLIPSNASHITLRSADTVNGSSLVVDADSDLTLDLLPAANQSGSVFLTVSVSDGMTSTAKSFILNISQINDPPELFSINDQIFSEDIANIEISFTAHDLEDSPCHLTMTITSSNESILRNDKFICKCNDNQYTLNVAPESNANGGLDINILAKDSGNLTTQKSFSLWLTPVNDPPSIIITDHTLETKKNIPLEITGISINDIDAEDHPVMITLIAGSEGSFTFNGQNASSLSYTDTITEINSLLDQLVYQPAHDVTGSHLITITVNDLGHTGSPLKELSETDNITITVHAVNASPNISLQESLQITEDTTIAFTASVSDDDITITVNLDASNGLLKLNSVDGLSGNYTQSNSLSFTGTLNNINKALSSISYIPPVNFSGSDTITLTVSDNANAMDSQVMNVIIDPENDAPILTCAPLSYTINEDTSQSVSASITDVDSDNLNLLLEIANGTLRFTDPSSMNKEDEGRYTLTDSILKINMALNAFDFTPTANYSGEAGITITVNDQENPPKEDKVFISIQVQPVNDPPICELSSAALSISENLAVGTIVYTVVANDVDNDHLTYSLQSPGPFAISPSGNIWLAEPVNYEDPGSKAYTLIASVSDNLSTCKQTINVTIININDPPVIISPTEIQPVNQGGSLTFSTISISDEEPDSESIQVSLTVLHGTISIDTLNVNIVSGVTSSDFISFTGTFENINNALKTMCFYSSPEYLGTASIVIDVNYMNLAGSGESQQASKILSIPVTDDVAPMIGSIEDQTIDEDANSTDISFTVTDFEGDTMLIEVITSNINLFNSIILSNASGGNSYTLITERDSDELKLTLTPNADQSGSAAITITVSDGVKDTMKSFEMTIREINDPPEITTILDQTFSEDTQSSAIAFTVSDVDATSLTISVVSNDPTLVSSENITLMDNSGGHTNSLITNSQSKQLTLFVMPEANASGQTTISVSVTDGHDQIVKSFSINVTPVNDNPEIPQIANQTINEDTSISIPFTVTDVDRDALLITVKSNNQSIINNNHSIVIDENGSSLNIPEGSLTNNMTLTLLPEENAHGAVTLTVRLADPFAVTEKKFHLTVVSVNDCPEINDKKFTIEENLSNTSEVGNLTVSDIDGDNLSLSILTGNSDDAFSIDDTGKITVNNTEALDFENKTTFNLTVQVSDGYTFATASVTINLADVNEVPEISSIIDQKTEEDTAIVIPFVITDVDKNDLTISVSINNDSIIDSNLISINGAGSSLTITEDSSSHGLTMRLNPKLDSHGKVTITVNVVDSGLLSDQKQFILTVTPVNDKPIINNDTFNIDENSSVSTIVGQVSTTDVDADNLTLSIINGNSNDAFYIENDGEIIVNKDVLNFEEQSSYTLTVEVSDGKLTDTAQILIVIGDKNESPTMTSTVKDIILNEYTSTSPIAFTVHDIDGDALTITISSSNEDVVAVNANHITLCHQQICNPANTIQLSQFTGVQDLNLAIIAEKDGKADITITVSDGFLYTSTSFSLTVNNVNIPPVIENLDMNYNMLEDSSLPISFTVYDQDCEGRNVTIKVSTDNDELLPAHGPYVLFDSDVFQADPAKKVELTLKPISNQFGVCSISITATDADGTSVSKDITIEVNMLEDDDPEISVIPDCEIEEDSSDQRSFTVMDHDGGQLTITVQSSNIEIVPVENIWLNGSQYDVPYTTTLAAHVPQSMTLTISPKGNANGDVSIHVIATDAQSHKVTRTFAVTVKAVNDKPDISAIGNIIIDEDTRQYPVSINIFDADVDQLQLNALSSNTKLISNSDLKFSQNPVNTTKNAGTTVDLNISTQSNENGSADVSITVTDSKGLTDTEKFTITVRPLNDPPELVTTIPDQTATEYQPFSFTIPANTFKDIDSPLTYSARLENGSSLPDWLSFNASTIAFSGIPTNDDIVTLYITVTATDDHNESAFDTFTLSMQAKNDTPTLSLESPTFDFQTDEDTSLTNIFFSVADVDDTMLTITVDTDPNYFKDIQVCAGNECGNLPFRWFSQTTSLKYALSILQYMTDIAMHSISGLPDIDSNSERGLPEAIYCLTNASKTNRLSLLLIPKDNISGNKIPLTLNVHDHHGLKSSQQLNITIKGVPDIPTLSVDNLIIDEDSTKKLSITATPGDTSEELKAIIKNIPSGAKLNLGNRVASECTLDQDDIDKINTLTITPPENSSEDFQLTVELISTDNEQYISASVETLMVTVKSVPDEPMQVVMKSKYLSVNEGETISVLFETLELADTDGSEQWAKIEVKNIPLKADFSKGTVKGNTLTISSDEMPYTNTRITDWGFTITPNGPNDSSYTMTVIAYSNDEDNRNVTRSKETSINLKITSQSMNTDVSDTCFISSSYSTINITQLFKMISTIIFLMVLASIKLGLNFRMNTLFSLLFVGALCFVSNVNNAQAEQTSWSNIDWKKYQLIKFEDFEYVTLKPMITMESLGSGQVDEVFVLPTETEYSSPLGFQIGAISKKNSYNFEATLEYISSFDDDAGGKSNSVNVINIMGSWKWPYAFSDRFDAFAMIGLGIMITQQDLSYRGKSFGLNNMGLSSRLGVGMDWKIDNRWSIGMELATTLGIGDVDFMRFNSLNLVGTYRFGQIKSSLPQTKDQNKHIKKDLEDQILALNDMKTKIVKNGGSKYAFFECEKLSQNYEEALSALNNNKLDMAKQLIDKARSEAERINSILQEKVALKIKDLEKQIEQLDSNLNVDHIHESMNQARKMAGKLEISDALSKLDTTQKDIASLLKSVCQKASERINETKSEIDSLQVTQIDHQKDIERAKELLNMARHAFHNKLCKDAIDATDQANEIVQSLSRQMDNQTISRGTAQKRLTVAKQQNESARKLADTLQANYSIPTLDIFQAIEQHYMTALNAFNVSNYHETIKHANLTIEKSKTLDSDIKKLAKNILSKKMKKLDKQMKDINFLIDKMSIMLTPMKRSSLHDMFNSTKRMFADIKSKKRINLLDKFNQVKSVEELFDSIEHDIRQMHIKPVHARVILEAAGNDPKATDFIKAKKGLTQYLSQLKQFGIRKHDIDVRSAIGYQDQIQFMETISEIQDAYPMFQADSSFRAQLKKSANSFSYAKGLRKLVYALSSQRTVIIPDDLKPQTDYLKQRKISFSCIFIDARGHSGARSLQKMAKQTRGLFRVCKSPKDIRKALQEIFQQ
jgi:VCBS repeat-containing protein